VAVELARIANDELAQLVQKYPDRFASGIATLPKQTD
jgi:predicted TIM-barrel fold metal-dependent hydrolase